MTTINLAQSAAGDASMCLGPNDLPTTAVAIATVVASKTGTYVCSVRDWVVHSAVGDST